MARLTVERLAKSFGAFRALDDVSLQVDDGEFVAILGASGCGKTTLLRQVAGFDKPDSGRILIGDSVVSSATTHVPPERRRLGIVFQSYALWPHMSVAENVAYGLTVTGVKGAERSRRVDAALDLVDLHGYAQRTPAMLSGGQRQRVALARCLVTEPALVLLDEPLANLDVHLRAAMENEFARFHERTGTTMVYITHDQAEAMALADRIAVMDNGRLLQLAAPSQLYREPATATVARFVGHGMVLPVSIRSVAADGTCAADLYGHVVRLRCAPTAKANAAAQVCLRAGDLTIVAPTAAGVAARVDRAVYQGGFFRLEAHIDAAPDQLLHLAVPEPFTLAAGAAIKLDVADGWIIPETTGN
jgi:iron(III) transport system ATP-binding protein